MMDARKTEPERIQPAKILPVEAIAMEVARLKGAGKAVVLCHGVFDLVHPGHIKHLQAAKREGDFLVVTLTADRHVNKGPGRPIFNEQLRAENLAALEVVDLVAVSGYPTAVEVISTIKPDVYVKGSDYAEAGNDLTGKIIDEESAIEAVGGRLFFTDEDTFSSSSLINRHMQIFSPSTEDWLADFRTKYSARDVIAYLDAITDLKILVIGEAIIDEYVFCNALGKTAKDPILAFHYSSTETYAGGSLAVANHMAGFMKNVGILTILGSDNSRKDFITRSLSKNIAAHFILRAGVPTIHKRRFIDSHSGTKPFELYEMDDSALPDETEAEVIAEIKHIAKDYDIVVVTDYGHGMMTAAVIETLTAEAKFLAVNTQANAGNRGFNTLTRYARADYVSIAGNELELEVRVRGRSFSDSLVQLADQIDCRRFTITLGRDGSLHFDKDSGFTEGPALAIQVLDRVGAGDAVLSVTTPLVANGAPWDLIAFITNLAGAEMVGHLGNRNSLDGVSMSKHVEAILK